MLRLRKVCIPSAILVAVALPSVSQAAPTVAVVGVHQASLDQADQQRAVDGLVKAIEASGRFDALTPAEVGTALAGREAVVLEEGLLAMPGEKLASGKNAYNQASWDDAIGYLEDAVDGFGAVFRGTNNQDDLWDALVYLGSCHLLKDPPDALAARTAFGSAVALSPTKPLNPALFPPDVVTAYLGVQKDLAPQHVAIQIGSAATAKVWLDGVEKGSTPATVPDVVPGQHYVVARSPTSQGFLRVNVRATENGAAMPIDVPLANPSLGESSTSPVGRSSQVNALYHAIGARSEGVDYVLAVGVVDSVLSVQLLDVSNNVWSRAIELPYSDDSDDEAVQAVPLLLNGVGADGRFSAIAPAPAMLDIGSNSALALLLTEPGAGRIATAPVPPSTGGNHKGRAGVVLGIVGGLVLASGVGAGTYLYTTREPVDPNQGVVVIQF